MSFYEIVFRFKVSASLCYMNRPEAAILVHVFWCHISRSFMILIFFYGRHQTEAFLCLVAWGRYQGMSMLSVRWASFHLAPSPSIFNYLVLNWPSNLTCYSGHSFYISPLPDSVTEEPLGCYLGLCSVCVCPFFNSVNIAIIILSLVIVNYGFVLMPMLVEFRMPANAASVPVSSCLC